MAQHDVYYIDFKHIYLHCRTADASMMSGKGSWTPPNSRKNTESSSGNKDAGMNGYIRNVKLKRSFFLLLRILTILCHMILLL